MTEALSAVQPAPSSRRLALFLVSAGVLQAQIALSKVFSVVLWYHFGFLVISLAMLGFAMAGVSLARRPAALEKAPSLFARSAGAAALWSVFALWLVAHTDVDAQHLFRDRNEGPLVALIAVWLVPFFFLGRAVSATLTYHRSEAGTVYAANLLGSGAGCGLAVVLFDALHLSAQDVVLASAGLMAVGGLLFALSASTLAAVSSVAAAVLVGGLFACPERQALFHLEAPPSKPLSFVEDWVATNGPKRVVTNEDREVVYYGPETVDGDDFVVRTPYEEEVRVPIAEVRRSDGTITKPEPTDLIEFRRWTSLSRVDAFTWPYTLPTWGLWGISSTWEGEQPRQKGITIDTWAMTNVLEWDRTPDAEGNVPPPPEILEYLPSTLVHRIRENAKVLCIGAGGGMDLLAAKRFGQPDVTGVEINPSVVAAVQERFLDFQGGLYDPDDDANGVTIHVAEGRHFLERDDSRYDIVQLSGVDTASTTQAGAFSLSENFLYTEQAFDTYLEHTTDDGIVTLTRWVLPDPETLEPRNTLRLFVLAWGALERAGVTDPSGHLYLVESNGFSVILFGRQPFSEFELATLDEAAERYAFRPLFHPSRPSPWTRPDTGEELTNHWEAFAAAPDKQAFLAAYAYDVSAPTDDRPFFFETSRFERLFEKQSLLSPLGGPTAHAILIALLVLVTLVAWAFVIQPLLRGGTGTDRIARRPAVLLYFACLGLGFIFVEVVLAQKFVLFLGNPVYSLAVVLFSVLVFSGLGSAFSQRLGGPSLPLLAVVALAAGYPFFLDLVFETALPLPDPARIAVAVGLLAPLSFAMGMPFAIGLRKIAPADARLGAWAWGINGYTSVIGSVVTVVLSLTFGFRMVVWIGAGVYALAFLVAPLLTRRGALTTQAPAEASIDPVQAAGYAAEFRFSEESASG